MVWYLSSTASAYRERERSVEEWEEEEEEEDERVRERRDGRVRRVTKYAIAEGSSCSLSACSVAEPR